MRTALLFFAFLLLSGCAGPAPKYTLAELSEMTTRTYQGKTKEEVYAAAAKIFEAADKKNNQITLFGDEFRASRLRYVFFIPHTFDWRLKVVQQEADVKVSANAVSKMDLIEHIEGAGVYALFFDRLDYLLGKRKDWVTCETAQRAIDAEGRKESLASLCILSDDSKPVP